MQQIIALLVLFTALRSIYFDLLPLSEDAYFTPYFFLRYFGNERLRVLLCFITLPALVLYWRISWKKFTDIPWMRGVMSVLILAAAFDAVFYQHNFYFGQDHLEQRVIVLALCFASLLTPAFFPIFLVAVFSVIHQFDYGLPDQFGWENRYPLYVFLVLFHAWILVKAVVKGVGEGVFLFVAICLQASHYFYSGVEKLFHGHHFLDWARFDQLHRLYVSHYLNGWLKNVREDVILQVADVLQRINPILTWGTLAFELGALFILARRGFTTLLLLLFILFHWLLAIGCGIFFWRWILLDICLLGIILSFSEENQRKFFTPAAFLVSLPVIFFSGGLFTNFPYFHPMRLAWVDSPVNSIYLFEGIKLNGEAVELPANFFTPYHYPVLQNEFSYLHEDKRIVYHSGMVRSKSKRQSFDLARILEEARTSEKLAEIREQYGERRYDPDKLKQFDQFMKRLILEFNHRQLSAKEAFHPLFFIWDKFVPLEEPLRGIRVKLRETYYSGTAITTLREIVVREVFLDHAGKATLEGKSQEEEVSALVLEPDEWTVAQ